MIRRVTLALACCSLLVASAACEEQPASTGATDSASPPGSVASAAASAAAPAQPTIGPVAASAVPPGAKACGPLACLEFKDAPAALTYLVKTQKPQVLAVGEAHAQKGTEDIPSATKRFTEEMLPVLKDHASDLVLELWFPNPKCKKKVAAVQKQQKAVTKTQAKSNPNEYVNLGNSAKKLGIVPTALKPSCDELDAITRAGQQDIALMLETVARHTARDSERLLRRNADAGTPDKMVVAYGGLMHNDPAPTEARKAWSFGPHLVEKTGGRYVAVDLIVPEYIKDSPVWKSLPWYDNYDSAAQSSKTILFQVEPKSYVLIFPKHAP